MKRQYAARPMVRTLAFAIRAALIQAGATGLRPFGV